MRVSRNYEEIYLFSNYVSPSLLFSLCWLCGRGRFWLKNVKIQTFLKFHLIFFVLLSHSLTFFKMIQKLWNLKEKCGWQVSLVLLKTFWEPSQSDPGKSKMRNFLTKREILSWKCKEEWKVFADCSDGKCLLTW